MAAIDFAVQMIFLAGLSISYSSHLATLFYQAALLRGWEGDPQGPPPPSAYLPHPFSVSPLCLLSCVRPTSGAQTVVGRRLT